MKIIFITAFVIAAACSTKTMVTNDKASQLYKTYCASCHGKNMEAFVDRKWKYGESDDAIYKVIKSGNENAGMPAYEKSLTDSEIKLLVSYIKQAKSLANNIPHNSKKSSIYRSEDMIIKIDTITEDVDVPWGMDFLPDNTMLITDRDGDFYHRYTDGKMIKISNTPKVFSRGQGGLLDVMVHPQFSDNNIIFISYSKLIVIDSKEKSTTAVIRAEFKNDTLYNIKEIFLAKPYFETQHHYGSRLCMDDEGYLYISIGERGKEKINPQDLSSDCGKVHRINEDGSVPQDNPFVNKEGASPSIFTYGHRNPQGMAINPETKKIWVNEHGPRGGDEINVLAPGLNFGWPVTTYGINYNGTTITDKTSAPGITDPIHYWIPSIAPCGAIFVTGDKYGKWNGDYLVPSLSFNYLNRCRVVDDKVDGQEKLLQDIGRMRSIKQDKEGYIYIGVENPGMILKLTPIW